jgi:hypothetical protein
MGHPTIFLVDVEVENVGDLEVRPVHENQIATDEDVHVTRRRRGKHDFQFMRAWLHPTAKLDGHESLSNKEALLARRQAIAHGQAWRQMAVVRVIPVANVAVMVAVCLAPFVFDGAVMVAVSAMIVVAIVPVITVIVILRESKCSGKREGQQSDGAHAET